ncbi:MAG: hypothetical protein LBO78_01880 [Rickettsiales bacterium]|jgi:hypothetical protein|nr:hypothetical protein [Rickettsiales bacterium]
MNKTIIISLSLIAGIAAGANAAKPRPAYCPDKCIAECDRLHFAGCDKSKPGSCSGYAAKHSAAWKCKITTSNCFKGLTEKQINCCSKEEIPDDDKEC